MTNQRAPAGIRAFDRIQRVREVKRGISYSECVIRHSLETLNK
jgi:hypothetical protein